MLNIDLLYKPNWTYVQNLNFRFGTLCQYHLMNFNCIKPKSRKLEANLFSMFLLSIMKRFKIKRTPCFDESKKI